MERGLVFELSDEAFEARLSALGLGGFGLFAQHVVQVAVEVDRVVALA